MEKKNIKKTVVEKKKPSLLLSLQKEVKLLKKSIEKKGMSLESDAAQVDATLGDIASLSVPIVSGLDNFQRVGDKVNMLYVQSNIWMYLQTTTVSGQGSFDLILDRAPTGVLPVITDIFASGEPQRLIRFEKKARFKSLRHFHWTFGTYGIDSKGQIFEFFHKFNNVQTVWTGITGAEIDFKNGKNELLLVFRSSQASAGSLSYGYKGNHRICFTDA